jgi:phosphoribosyl-ATP pyrophosphohydrolase/phosphoribosyl-AMP cyclohydrolase
MKNIKTVVNPDFSKLSGLVPAVIQDHRTLKVLMLGFMNEEAFRITCESSRVTFYSRTKNRLWTKGEESGNFLEVIEILADCDNDTLLIKASPMGPVCHTGADTCWNEPNQTSDLLFLEELQNLVDSRKAEMPEGSYTTSLFRAGTGRIAQKVGEEAVETIIGAMSSDDLNFLNEGADLLYHLIVLLSDKGYRIGDLVAELRKRHK